MSDVEFFGDIFQEEKEADEIVTSVNPPPAITFFVALAGQTTDVVLLSGGGSDKLLQAGH